MRLVFFFDDLAKVKTIKKGKRKSRFTSDKEKENPAHGELLEPLFYIALKITTIKMKTFTLVPYIFNSVWVNF